MEKRIFAAVLISIAMLWIWAAVAPKLFPNLVKQPRPNTAQTAPAKRSDVPAAATTAASSTAAKPAQTPAIAASTAPAVQPTNAQTVVLTRVATPDFIATFSNRGAQLV